MSVNVHAKGSASGRAARLPRPARPDVPALPPLQRLDRCHHKMVEMLADMSQLVDQLASQGADAAMRARALAVYKFFSTSARQHHADEETLVFPLLIRSGDAALTRHVLRLQQDHGWLEEDWLEIAPQLQAVAYGHSGYDLESLRQAVAVFSVLYREHIALEETLIYPEARRQLAVEVEAARGEQRLPAGTAEPGTVPPGVA